MTYAAKVVSSRVAERSAQKVIAALEEALGDLSDGESRQMFGANARRFRRLALPRR